MPLPLEISGKLRPTTRQLAARGKSGRREKSGTASQFAFGPSAFFSRAMTGSELVTVHGSPHFSLPCDFRHGLLGPVQPRQGRGKTQELTRKWSVPRAFRIATARECPWSRGPPKRMKASGFSTELWQEGVAVVGAWRSILSGQARASDSGRRHIRISKSPRPVPNRGRKVRAARRREDSPPARSRGRCRSGC